MGRAPLFMAGDAAAAAAALEDEETKSESDSNLPEIQGDFDWDEKFGDDDDWITENVPGKIVMGEIELAKQVTALDKLEEKWRKERLYAEYEAGRKTGWVEEAEILNSRTAMFFLVTGLLTEYWTEYSIPDQVEEMLRIAGLIGFEDKNIMYRPFPKGSQKKKKLK